MIINNRFYELLVLSKWYGEKCFDLQDLKADSAGQTSQRSKEIPYNTAALAVPDGAEIQDLETGCQKYGNYKILGRPVL